MMKISISNFLYLIWLLATLCATNSLYAQQTDVRLRLYGGIDKDITKKLNAGFEYEHRFDNYLSTFDKAFIEPSLAYSIDRNFRVGASYRAALSQTNSRNKKIQQRSSAYIQYRFRFDYFRVRLRSIIQYGFDDITNTTSGSNRNIVNRNSIQADYSIFGTKFRPYAKYELFYHINHPRGGIFNQQRATLGTQYRLSRNTTIATFYMFQGEMNVIAPVNSHIIGFGFSYSL
jgi:hypothetical protein